MEFIETDVFSKRIQAILSDEEYGSLQAELIQRPDLGNLVPGAKGLRKLRWSVEGKGKRGGARIIYFWYVTRDLLLMLYAFKKSEQDDLTREQMRMFSELVDRGAV